MPTDFVVNTNKFVTKLFFPYNCPEIRNYNINQIYYFEGNIISFMRSRYRKTLLVRYNIVVS